jgi:hypothetical protein
MGNILMECQLKHKEQINKLCVKKYNIISQFTGYGNNGTHKVLFILK